MEEYKGKNSKKHKFLHKKCGSVINKQLSKMIGKCPEYCYICSGKNKHKTTQYYIEEIDLIYGKGIIDILGDYINAKTPIPIHRNDCGHDYLVAPTNLLRLKGCPRCSIRQSSYMDEVENILEELKIKYEKEKRFEDCVNIRTLPFDYYLKDYNCIIEVDGEFHYKDNTFKDEKNSLEEVKRRDEIKNDYCKNNNIKLIRLPYFEKENFRQIIIQNLFYENTEVTKETKESLVL